jgi:hypothetical protein
MTKDDKFSKAVDEQRRRELGKAIDSARRGEHGGFSEVVDLVHETDGVPDKIYSDVEIGVGFIDSAEDHAADN